MEAKQIVFFFLLFTVIITVSFSSEPLQYQAFIPTSLPKVAQDFETLSWDMPQQFSDSESETPLIVLRLHHVDHLSPSSNSTPESLFLNRLQRDAVRARTIASQKTPNFSSSISSGSSVGSGEYITLIGIGTPANRFYLTIDTGSDVTWLQCQPCHRCYRQHDPIFDPKTSTSFASVYCNSPLCNLIGPLGCTNQRDKCQYRVIYGDQSTTLGELSTETLTFGATKLPHLPIGCGHDNEGLFAGAAGLLGLGQGTLSFPAQARINKFSYCLVEWGSKSRSYLMFGDSAVSTKAFFTPLLNNPKMNTFYYVELMGFSVGGNPVRGINPSLFKLSSSGSGGVIVDSGTSVTRLVQPAYNALRKAFNDSASSYLKPAKGFQILDTCFDLRGLNDVNVPAVELHFQGAGADLSLPASNILIPVDNKGTFCFAFAGKTSPDRLSIIGNFQQQGFRVSFDLDKKRIGFAPESC
ncbi:Eukaryotic aspartyl protease family protein [Striga hermonthica]|uniref:Eukaryotic aspartyl protease family protein n=1 Tax=Striga hermonthica TaxID=68872 RepID=A0A9N7RKG1_STRHE|nr:Eukaryotic aspartyl protease family protein [Striga hermonthica]